MKKFLSAPLFALIFSLLAVSTASAADASSPDVLIKTITQDVLNTAKSDQALHAGDLSHITALVNEKILPYTDFERTTQIVVGRYWRQATPQQRSQLIDQFKQLLIRTYSGAISQIQNQTIEYLPYRAAPDATDTVVRTRVNNQGQTIELDYRLEKTARGWRVYDLNVLGAWLIQTYQQQFAEQIQRDGIDGLIKFLTARNAQLAKS